MLLCFQPCCAWNNNRVWMRWLFVAKGLSPAVTAQQSAAGEMLISHKQRLWSRADAAQPWAPLSTCSGAYLFNNSFNRCTNSFPDAADRYFSFQMLVTSLASFFLMNEKKNKRNLCPACLEHFWVFSDVLKPNIQITSVKWSLHTRPFGHKGQAVRKKQQKRRLYIFCVALAFIPRSFFDCCLRQRGCSSVAVFTFVVQLPPGQRRGTDLLRLVWLPWCGWCVFGATANTLPCCSKTC